MNYFILALKKYAQFSGRSSRSEYWYFFLYNILINALFSGLSTLTQDVKTISTIIFIVSLVITLFLLVPGLAVAVRRLHDLGKSAWMMLILLIPIIGVIWFIILMSLPSSLNDNKYGPVVK